MIQSVNITQRVITARVTSGGRKTSVSVTSSNRIRAAFIGKQGPRGADGPAGGYVHTQSSGAAEWTVNHNFGYKPNTEIYDGSGNVVDAQVLHVSANQLKVYFSSPQTGSVRCI